MTILLAAACVCVTCCSSMAGSTYAGMKAEFGVGEEVCILSISLFVAGLGVGPCKSSLVQQLFWMARFVLNRSVSGTVLRVHRAE